MKAETWKSCDEAYRLTVTVVCAKCGQQVDGWIGFSVRNQIVDSGAFMVLGDEAVCDWCLENPQTVAA